MTESCGRVSQESSRQRRSRPIRRGGEEFHRRRARRWMVRPVSASTRGSLRWSERRPRPGGLFVPCFHSNTEWITESARRLRLHRILNEAASRFGTQPDLCLSLRRIDARACGRRLFPCLRSGAAPPGLALLRLSGFPVHGRSVAADGPRTCPSAMRCSNRLDDAFPLEPVRS